EAWFCQLIVRPIARRIKANHDAVCFVSNRYAPRRKNGILRNVDRIQTQAVVPIQTVPGRKSQRGRIHRLLRQALLQKRNERFPPYAWLSVRQRLRRSDQRSL